MSVNRVSAILILTLNSLPLLGAPFAYISTLDGSVSVVDTSNDIVVDTVDVGSAGPGGVGVHPDGSRVYVKNTSVAEVAVVDTASNTVIATIEVGLGPADIAVVPDGGRVYVALYDLDIVAVIDAASNMLLWIIPVGDGPFGIDVSPDSSRVYIANRWSDTVTVINNVSQNVVTDIQIGDGDGGIAVHPDGSRVYLTSFNIDLITVIDSATNQVIETMSSPGAFGVAVSPDGERLWVTNFSDGTVEVWDTESNTRISVIPVGYGPYGIDLTPDGLYVYVVNYWDTTISVINTNTLTVERTMYMQQRVFSFSSFIGPSATGGFLTGCMPGAIVVACVNITTGQNDIMLLPRGHTNWSCKSVGVEVNSGDLVYMLQWGTRDQSESEPLGGTASAIVPGAIFGRCENLSTTEVVEFNPEPGKVSWDYSAIGMESNDGDKLFMYQIIHVE